MSTMTGHDFPAAMRASDADRDAAVAELGEHFQAGRLTAEELDERTGRALTARTWGELRAVRADLPDTGSAPRIPASAGPAGAGLAGAGLAGGPRGFGPGVPVRAALAGLVIAALVLAVANIGWGLIWLFVPVLLMARRAVCFPGGLGRCGHRD